METGSSSFSNRLLTVCPSRIRPDRVMDMLKSYDKTKSDFNDIVIYVANDDPRLDEYRRNLAGRNLVIGDRLTKVGVDNYCCCSLYPHYKYYSEINDDHIYHTVGWDKVLVDAIEAHGGWGFACGNLKGLPSGMVISGNIVRALGYQCTPLLEQAYSDNFHQELGEALGMFYRVSGVEIEHRHWVFGKADIDANYAMVTSHEHMEKGRAGLNEWREKYKQRDIEKVLSAKNRGVDSIVPLN